MQRDHTTTRRTTAVAASALLAMALAACAGGPGVSAAAWSTDDDRFDGITFDDWVTDDIGLAAALIEGSHDANSAEGADPHWSAEMSDAEIIVDGTIGELSVMWSTYLERWIMTYSDGGSAYIREGVTPWGPWGEPIELVSGAEYPAFYSPYLNPRYVSDDGKTIYFTLSLWDSYNVVWFSANLERTSP